MLSVLSFIFNDYLLCLNFSPAKRKVSKTCCVSHRETTIGTGDKISPCDLSPVPIVVSCIFLFIVLATKLRQLRCM